MALFGQLYISLQNRDGQISEFFAHEVQSYPPSCLSLESCLVPNVISIEEPNKTEAPVLYDCKVEDGAVTVYVWPLKDVSPFQEYPDNVFIPYLKQQLRDTKRVDIVWDEFRQIP